jgi:hypothetical protein
MQKLLTSYFFCLMLVWSALPAFAAPTEDATRAVSFLQPTYIAAATTNDTRLIGTWLAKTERDPQQLVIRASPSGGYEMELLVESETLKLTGIAFRTDTNLYIDITVLSRKSTNPISFLTQIPGHLVMKVEAVGKDHLKLNLINYHELFDTLKAQPQLLEYYDEGFRVVVTSSSKQIMNALQKREFNSRLFDPKECMSFVKEAPKSRF